MLALVPVLTNLQTLDATGTGITNCVIEELGLRCPNLQNLLAKECIYGLPGGAHLHVDETLTEEQKLKMTYGVTEGAVQQLADKLTYGVWCVPRLVLSCC